MAGPEPRLVLSVAAMTDTGRTRGHNEDYVTYHVPSEPQALEVEGALFLVCDGVGGGAAGEVASEHAAGRIMQDYYQPGNGSGPQAKLVAAIQRANSDIYAENSRSGDDRKMATTVVAALVVGTELSLAHAGDSRAYLVRDGHISQLTRDHSWVAEMVEAGDLSEADAESHPWRNRITRSLGVSETVKLDTQSLPLKANDVVVLCSDGLTRHVKDVEIGAAASQNSPSVAAEQLIQLANSRGGSDNITALVVRLQAEDLAPTERVLAAPPPPLAAPTLLTTPSEAAPEAARPRRRWAAYVAAVAVVALLLLALVVAAALRLGRTAAGEATPQSTGSAPQVDATAVGATNVTATAEAPADVPSAQPSGEPTGASPAPAAEASATAGALASLLAEATAAAAASPEPVATVTSLFQGEVVSVIGVQLRIGPSASSAISDTLAVGTRFSVVGWSQRMADKCRSGIWLRAVMDDGTMGWVCGDGDLVRVNGQSVSADDLERLGVPIVPEGEGEPEPTATRQMTEAPPAGVFVSLTLSVAQWQMEPLDFTGLAPLEIMSPVSIGVSIEPFNLEPLVLPPLMTIDTLLSAPLCTPEASGAGICWPG